MFARWPVNSMFFMKKSYGSMPIAAAASSSAVIVIAQPCGWAGARQARALPILLVRGVVRFRWFGMLETFGKVVIVVPLHPRAMRLETAVGDHRQTVVAFHGDLGFAEAFVGIANFVLIGRFCVLARVLHISVNDKVRKHLVFDLDRAHCVFS